MKEREEGQSSGEGGGGLREREWATYQVRTTIHGARDHVSCSHIWEIQHAATSCPSGTLH
jgi:hypothetical protein